MSTVRAGLRSGLLIGIIGIFSMLLGLPTLAGTLAAEWFSLGSQSAGAWVFLLGILVWAGSRAAHSAGRRSAIEATVAGAATGAVCGLMLAFYAWGASSLVNAGVDVREWLVQISPEAVDLITFGLAPILAAVVVFCAMTLAASAGGLLAYGSARYHWRQSWAELLRNGRERILKTSAVERFSQYEHSQKVLYGIGLIALLAAPLVLGRYWNYSLGTVGIYVILGLGLNVVVGMAGLLNLGYVAFFAIGSYTVAMLTAPQYGIEWSFWVAVPIGMVLATVTGVLLSIPVLRMRGDYLAIVTLGFGEIIRILARSDALTEFSGGPRGIRSVASPSLFGTSLSSTAHFMYLILLGIVLAVFVTVRLQRSRLGRAWMAMREDEDVAQAMGIHTLKYKVLAFAIGAAFAGLGGVVFASRNRFTGPEDFTLLVSVNVLCVVVIGGLGSIPGIVVGALMLKGLPEVLRQFDDYRMLVFGALLIAAMILRPEGIWPSKRRQMELRSGEQSEKDVVLQSAGV